MLKIIEHFKNNIFNYIKTLALIKSVNYMLCDLCELIRGLKNGLSINS